MQLLTKERLCKIKTDPYYRAYNAAIISAADAVLGKPIEVISYQSHMFFYRNGVRNDAQAAQRRKSLAVLAFAYLLTEERRYLDCLEDYIWAICDEFAWAAPAHLKEEGMQNAVPFETQPQYIDLRAAEQAAIFAELDALLGDALSFRARRRLRMEVERRVLVPFESRLHKLFWESTVHNWASVCASNLGIAFLLLTERERFLAILPRLERAIGNFLDGFDTDGCCLEGVAYWAFGFGTFLHFADLLYRSSDGAVDRFADPKVHEIALFSQRSVLPSHNVINFADCRQKTRLHLPLLHLLAGRYPDVILPKKEEYNLDREADLGDFDFFRILQSYMWIDPTRTGDLHTRSYHHYMKDAEWFIERNDRYSFVAKAGHNAEPYLRCFPDWRERYENRTDRNEPHNHNDIGQFIFYSGDECVFRDLGHGTYYKDYFLPDCRYGYLPASSRGHSVPLIDGAEQSRDIYHSAKVLSVSDTSFSMDLVGAYDVDGLLSAVRSFQTDERGVTLVDTYRVAREMTVTERFVAASEPTVGDGFVSIGRGRLYFDPSVLTPQLIVEQYDGDGCKLAYFVDFTFTVKSEASVTFRMQ